MSFFLSQFLLWMMCDWRRNDRSRHIERGIDRQIERGRDRDGCRSSRSPLSILDHSASPSSSPAASLFASLHYPPLFFPAFIHRQPPVFTFSPFLSLQRFSFFCFCFPSIGQFVCCLCIVPLSRFHLHSLLNSQFYSFHLQILLYPLNGERTVVWIYSLSQFQFSSSQPVVFSSVQPFFSPSLPFVIILSSSSSSVSILISLRPVSIFRK